MRDSGRWCLSDRFASSSKIAVRGGRHGVFREDSHLMRQSFLRQSFPESIPFAIEIHQIKNLSYHLHLRSLLKSDDIRLTENRSRINHICSTKSVRRWDGSKALGGLGLAGGWKQSVNRAGVGRGMQTKASIGPVLAGNADYDFHIERCRWLYREDKVIMRCAE